MTQKSNTSDCKHDRGFTLYQWKEPEDLGVWLCNYMCGFHLNFDPFKYPHGVAYVIRKDSRILPEWTWEGKNRKRNI